MRKQLCLIAPALHTRRRSRHEGHHLRLSFELLPSGHNTGTTYFRDRQELWCLHLEQKSYDTLLLSFKIPQLRQYELQA